MRTGRTTLCVVLLTSACGWSIGAQPATRPSSDLLQDLQKVAEQGEKAHSELLQSVRTEIERDPNGAFRLLLPKLRDPQANDEQLLVYLWAVSLTRSPDAEAPIIAVAESRAAKSDKLKVACARVLGDPGSARAGACVMSLLEGTSNEEARFELLNVLAEMQYEPAIPKALEVLKVDPKELYWQPIFIFGKLGDIAVPALLKELDSSERNVRANAVMILGTWLMASEASPALQKRFRQEEDAELRMQIFAALERTMTDLNALARFAAEVAANDKDEKVRRFAQETGDNIPKLEQQLKGFQQGKVDDRAAMDQEYARLDKSRGNQGSTFDLGRYTRPGDEPRLKDLRRRILRRNSDECFYDYQEVNRIILLDRHLAARSASQPTSSTSQP